MPNGPPLTKAGLSLCGLGFASPNSESGPHDAGFRGIVSPMADRGFVIASN
jgi:hypothetical protein